MSVRERLSAGARVVWIALATGCVALPYGAGAGSLEPGNITAGPETPAQVGRAVPQAPLAPLPLAEPFGLPRGDEQASAYAAKWRDVRDAVDEDGNILSRCRREPDQCPSAARQLLAVVEAAQAKEGRARLGEVNRAINLAIRYQGDVGRHGTPDAWASPLATLSTGHGDCEDYAIAKYLALREAGTAPGDLRLVVVWDARLRQRHAVLTARLDGRWLVLDNRRLLLLEDHDVRDYVALTAFGADPGPLLVASDEGENAIRPPVSRPEQDPS